MRRILFFSTVAVVLSATVAASAQPNDDRRVTQLEKQVRELRSIVFQGRDTGQPVVVKPEGPDPALIALQQRVDQLEETLRKQNGQLEVLSHDVDEARQAAASARDAGAETRGQLQALTDRLSRIETQVQAMASAPPPQAPPPLAAAPAPMPPPAPANLPASAPPPGPEAVPPPPPPATASETFRRARALLNGGDYQGATDAFQDYISRFGDSPRAAEARYFLGESYFAREAFADAARSYAEALKGWPVTSWAPDALVKLAQALEHVDRRPETCAALSAFDQRYAAHAPAAVRERADATRDQARCAAADPAAPPAPKLRSRTSHHAHTPG